MSSLHHHEFSFKDILCPREDHLPDRVISQYWGSLLHYSTLTGNFYDSFQSCPPSLSGKQILQTENQFWKKTLFSETERVKRCENVYFVF